jgi:hypothetical protein
MKFSSFMNGCGGKILTVILSIVLGIIIAFGGIAAGGYILLTKKGMLLNVEEIAQNNGIDVDFDDTLAEGTILEWGTQVSALLKDSSNATIGGIESLIGMSVISNALNEMLGIDQTVFTDATLSDIGETISDNLTMSIAQEKFGITFPDMPIFTDEEFLSKPIGEAFSDLDEYEIGELIIIDENSNVALQALQNVAIKDLAGTAGSDAINGLCICELIDIDDSSSQTLQALKYCTISSFYTYDENEEKIVDDDGRYVYQTKTLLIENDDNSFSELSVEMQGISDKMNELTVSEVIDITEESNAVLRKMRVATQDEIDNGLGDLFGTEDLLVEELGGSKFTDIVNSMEIGELIDIYEEDVLDTDNVTVLHEKSEPILIALKDTRLDGLNDKIQVLQVNEIFDESDLTSGALSLIDGDTTLANIPSAMTATMQTSKIITLKEKGLISSDSFTNMGDMELSQQSFIYNSSLGDVLGNIINFIADPVDTTDTLNPIVNYSYIEHDAIDLGTTETYSTLTEFVATYDQYERLSSTSATDTITITVDATTDDYSNFYNADDDCYYIPLFNLETATDILFVDSDSNTVDVKLAIMDVEEVVGSVPTTYTYTLAKHQYGFYYSYSDQKIDAISTILYENIVE